MAAGYKLAYPLPHTPGYFRIISAVWPRFTRIIRLSVRHFLSTILLITLYSPNYLSQSTLRDAAALPSHLAFTPVRRLPTTERGLLIPPFGNHSAAERSDWPGALNRLQLEAHTGILGQRAHVIACVDPISHSLVCSTSRPRLSALINRVFTVAFSASFSPGPRF
ncbi:hypothetical protein J6590_027951 [Homalodisca vitripennis]|nr:hypothetical protein J6590_027951 [Homalodisca vitripennis]